MQYQSTLSELSASQFAAESAAATATQSNQDAMAEVTYVNDVAADRQSWTAAAGSNDVAYVSAIQGATATFGQAEYNAQVSYSNAQDSLQKTYTAASNAADLADTEAHDQATCTYTTTTDVANNTLAEAQTAASDTAQAAGVAAQGVYEVSAYSNHAAAMANAATSQGTPLAAYQALEAAADVTLTQAIVTAQYVPAVLQGGIREGCFAGRSGAGDQDHRSGCCPEHRAGRTRHRRSAASDCPKRRRGRSGGGGSGGVGGLDDG